MKDVQIESGVEECASGMEQSANFATVKDVRIMLRMEECALGMELRSTNEEECAISMVQQRHECVSSIGMHEHSLTQRRNVHATLGKVGG